MKGVSQFIVNVSDLLEAEGRVLRTVVNGEARRLRTATTSMAMGLSLLMIAVPLAMGGIGLLAVSMIWALEPRVGWTLAVGATGLTLLAVGIGLFVTCGARARATSA